MKSSLFGATGMAGHGHAARPRPAVLDDIEQPSPDHHFTTIGGAGGDSTDR